MFLEESLGIDSSCFLDSQVTLHSNIMISIALYEWEMRLETPGQKCIVVLAVIHRWAGSYGN